jgi:hypothetical protein
MPVAIIDTNILVVCSGALENHKCSRLFELTMSINNRITILCRANGILGTLSPIIRLIDAVNIAVVNKTHLNVSCSKKKCVNVRKK